MNDFYGVSKSMMDLKRRMEIRKKSEQSNLIYIFFKIVFTYILPFEPIFQYGTKFFNNGLVGLFMGGIHLSSTLFLSLIILKPENLILKGNIFSLLFQAIFVTLLFRYDYFFIPLFSIIVILGYLIGYYQIFSNLCQKNKT